MFKTTLSLCAATLIAASPVWAADPPPGLPSDLDALDLADKAPKAAPPAASPWRVFVEGAVGQGARRGAAGSDDTARGSLDLRLDTTVGAGLRAVLSNRLDLIRNDGDASSRNVNTLREAYLSWARTPDQNFDIGRVNLRHGAATGFNPTDWFKEDALRSVVTADPAVLRENRQGTFVLQGQQLWSRGAADGRLVAQAGGASERLDLLVQRGRDQPPQPLAARGQLQGRGPVCAATAAVRRGRYAHAGRHQPVRPDQRCRRGLRRGQRRQGPLAGRPGTGPGRAATTDQQRAAFGLTYTTGFNLSLTAEAEFNSAAPDRAEWDALATIDPAAPLLTLARAQRLQDLPTRRALFVHALWKDAFVPRLDLSAFVRHDSETSSRAQWLEVRYRFSRADLALQWLVYSGDPGSIFGTIPQRRAIDLSLRWYL